MKLNFSKLFYAKIALFILGVAVLASYNTQAFAQSADDFISEVVPSAPKPIPSVTFYDLKGNTRSVDEYSGNVVIVNFWAMWCYPCKKEMPSLDALEKKYADKGLKVVSISNDMSGTDGIQEFFDKNKITNLEVFIDKNSDTFKKFGLRGIPTSIIVDKYGMEVGRVSGYIDWTDQKVEQYIEKLLKGKV